MRFVMRAGLACLLAVCAFGQQRLAGGAGRNRPTNNIPGSGTEFRTWGSRTGFGNILFPGMGNAPTNPSNINMIPNTAAAQQRIWSRGGGYGYGGYGAIIPFPVFVGTYGYDASQVQPNQQQPNVVVVYPPNAQAPVQQAAVPQTAQPMVRDYGQGGYGQMPPDSQGRMYDVPQTSAPAPQAQPSAAAQGGDDQPLFLIALQDGTVYAANGFWVEDGTLHYMTPQGRHNQLSLALVDRETSARLNRGRNIDFALPGK